MKSKLIIAAAALLTLAACSSSKKADDAAQQPMTLAEKLAMLQQADGYAFGHHDDTAYGHTWEYAPDSSDVKAVTGDYPAIINWDLGMIEYGEAKNLDGVPFDYMREQIKRHNALGGINSISWHPRNPVTGGNSWDTSCSNVVERAVTPGDTVNTAMRQWIANAADFVASLKDDEGNAIEVIFRPWHEHTGEWFWWGQGYRTPEQYKALWKLTREIFDEKGIDNVLWAYSPDKSNCENLEQYMECYPGDEYVDIMGADVYHFNGEEGIETFNQWMKNCLGSAVEAAKQHGKIAALTETGSEGLELSDWYTRVLMPAIDGYPIAYITVWRNGYQMEKHYYVPYPGHPAEADFVKFYESPKSIFLQELVALEQPD